MDIETGIASQKGDVFVPDKTIIVLPSKSVLNRLIIGCPVDAFEKS